MTDKIISFKRGVPPAESFPNEELIECTRQVINKHSAKILQYGSAAGYEPLREYIARQYSVDVEQVVIGQGSLQLLDLLCLISLKEGGLVFVEQPTYDRTLTIFKRSNAEMVGFRLTDGQINIEEVKMSLEKGKIPTPFPILVDGERAVSKGLGIFSTDWNGSKIEQNIPTVFILDKNGTVQFKYISQNTFDRPGAEYLLKFIGKLNKE